jgi:hypothetical protein
LENPIPQSSSENLAPLQPLLQLGRNSPKPSNYLWDALKERARHYLNTQKTVRQEMLLSGELVSNFISGKQFLMPSLYEPGRFVPFEMPNANAQKRALNITQFYVSNCLFKWLLSNPDIKVEPAIDTDEAEGAADAATIIVDRYEREFYKARITIQEAMQGICWGSYIWRVFPDVGKPIATAVREVLENRDIELGEGFGQCGECGFAGTAKDFPEVSTGEQVTNLCPQCEAEAFVEPPARASVPTVVDQQEVPIFDLSAEIVPFTNSWWDLQYTFDESPWAIIRKRTNLGVIKALFGNVRIPESGGNSDIGLDIAERLAYSGTANAGYGVAGSGKTSLYKEPVTIDECWLSAGDYADIELESDVQTVSGQIIPKGRLVDTFPNRLLLQGLNEWSISFGLFKERHRDYTVQGAWYSKAMSGAGRGLSDLVEVNKLLNADHAQIHNYLRSVSTPAMAYRIEALGDENRAQYMGMPGTNLPITSSNLPEDARLDDIVRPIFQPQSVPGQMFDFTYNRTNELAQLMSHITDFSSGLPNVNNKTATGARITQANSNALFTPPLSIKKEVRVRMAEIGVDLYCKHVPIERYFPLKGKYGRMQGVYLSGASIKKDWLSYTAVEDSELPKNAEIKREDYTAFFLAFGGFEMYMMAKQSQPEMVQDVERAFGIKAEAEKYNQVEGLCLQRVKQMSQFAQMTEDPMALLMAIQPPISPMEDNVEAKIKWFRDYLDMDDGLEAPLQLRGAVEIVIQLYFQNMMEIQTAVSGAMGMAQQAGMPPPEEEAPPQETPDNQAKLADKQADREHKTGERKAQQTHEAKEKEKDRKHQKALLKMKPKGKAA